MNREAKRQLDSIQELLESIKTVDLIGTNSGDFYLEPAGYPEMTAELALAIKPVLIKHRNKILADQLTAEVGF